MTWSHVNIIFCHFNFYILWTFLISLHLCPDTCLFHYCFKFRTIWHVTCCFICICSSPSVVSMECMIRSCCFAMTLPLKTSSSWWKRLVISRKAILLKWSCQVIYSFFSLHILIISMWRTLTHSFGDILENIHQTSFQKEILELCWHVLLKLFW